MRSLVYAHRQTQTQCVKSDDNHEIHFELIRDVVASIILFFSFSHFTWNLITSPVIMRNEVNETSTKQFFNELCSISSLSSLMGTMWRCRLTEPKKFLENMKQKIIFELEKKKNRMIGRCAFMASIVLMLMGWDDMRSDVITKNSSRLCFLSNLSWKWVENLVWTSK